MAFQDVVLLLSSDDRCHYTDKCILTFLLFSTLVAVVRIDFRICHDSAVVSIHTQYLKSSRYNPNYSHYHQK